MTVTRPELLVDGSDNAFRELVHDALAFTARLAAIREGYGQLIGLSGIQYTILVSIAHLTADGPPGVRRIADHLNLSSTFVTTEVGKLVKAGLLIKEKHPTDKRRVLLTLTDAGTQKLTELSTIQQPVNNEHFGSLSRSEFEALHKMMRELVQSTDKALSLLGHLALTEKGMKMGGSPMD